MRPAALAAVGALLGVAGMLIWRESRGASAPLSGPPDFLGELVRLEARLADTLRARLGVSAAGLSELKRLEGFRAEPYADQAGHWTIGYGHKILPGTAFDRVSGAEAESLLLADVADAEGMIARYVTVPLSQGQHDALVSFLFNVDSDDNGSFSGSTLLKKLNAGDFAAVPGELDRWVYVTVGDKKIVSAGLRSRRAAEGALFLSA